MNAMIMIMKIIQIIIIIMILMTDPNKTSGSGGSE